MEQKNGGFSSMDEYIATFPLEIQEKLTALRTFIKSVLPEATEKISYQMPTFALHGNVIHFAAFKQHIGLYPGAGGVSAFEHELAGYKVAKGTIQLPLDKPLPFELIGRIAQHRAAENVAKAAAKRSKKKQERS